jgi:hypothetical protein
LLFACTENEAQHLIIYCEDCLRYLNSWCHFTAKDLKGVFAQSQNPNLNLSPLRGRLWHIDMKMKAFFSLSGTKVS